MAEVCSSSPTLTSTQTIRTQTVFTTFSPVVSTLPASTLTTTESASCGNSSSCSPTVRVTEIPGGTTTSSVPVVVTSQIETFSVSTYWGTSCSRSSTNLPSQTPPPPSTTTTTDVVFTQSSASTSTSLLSPLDSSSQPQVTTTIAVTTMPNGIVTSQTLTITTFPPEETTTIIRTSDRDASAKLTRVVGGAIGGAAALGILVLVVWYILKKRLASGSGGLNIFFERVNPPTKGYRQFDDGASTSSHQPFAGDERGMQQSFINLEQRSPKFSPDDSNTPWYRSFNNKAQGSRSQSRKFPKISHPHLLPDQPQGVDPFSSQHHHIFPTNV